MVAWRWFLKRFEQCVGAAIVEKICLAQHEKDLLTRFKGKGYPMEKFGKNIARVIPLGAEPADAVVLAGSNLLAGVTVGAPAMRAQNVLQILLHAAHKPAIRPYPELCGRYCLGLQR